MSTAHIDTQNAAPLEHTKSSEVERILNSQREAQRTEGDPSVAVRRDRVSRLAVLLLDNIEEIGNALSDDYGTRPYQLTRAFEGTAWVADHLSALTELESWVQPIEVPGGYIKPQPKGVVGVIGTWNFPIILSFDPVMGALAAGNRVILSFTEFHPRTARLLSDLSGKVFDEKEFAIVAGDLQTIKEFSTHPFDHIFFTGSPSVGSIVAQNAAKNLAPVTLELGGKNPVIIARNADLDLAAHRVAGTRALNSGQICLCPDYVFVPSELRDEFVAGLKQEFAASFPDYLNNPGVVSIVDDRNYDRVVGLLDDAVSKGATKITVAADDEIDSLPNRERRLVPPTILLDVPADARLASEEIFGPIIAVYTYDDVDEAIRYVAERPHPLGAYWYGQDDEDFQRFLSHTLSGGVTLNDGISHAFVPGAPFGGVGHSGHGAYHGKASFTTFSHYRTVLTAATEQGVSDGLLGRAVLDEGLNTAVQAGIAESAAKFREFLAD